MTRCRGSISAVDGHRQRDPRPTGDASTTNGGRAHIQSPAGPIARGIGLDRPFFDDKNRAFWILQSIGWSGYFFLRSLSGFANSMGWMWLVHTLLLTATGYSLTLLMASLFRRLITMQPLWTLVLSLAVVMLASTAFSVIETWSYATFLKPDAKPVGVEYLGAILLNFSLLAAWAALYYGINYFLLLEEQIDQRERLEGQASTAQLAMLRYQLNPHFLFNTLNSISTLVLLKQTERANAMLARLSSFLRYTLVNEPTAQGHARAGGRDAEALPRNREDALRRPAAAALQDRIRDDRRAPALAAAPAADRERDQICGHAGGERRRHLDHRAARGPGGAHRGRRQWRRRRGRIRARARRPASDWRTFATDWRRPMARAHRFETRQNERGGFSVIIEIPYETGDKA